MCRLSLRALLILSLGWCLGGCATMDKDECRTADWRAIGYEDGSRGYHPSRLAEHREACAEHGIRPNLDAYRRGHRNGARQYCKPHTAYRLGMRGAAYNDICPADLEQSFLAAYDYGQDIHRLQRELNTTQRQIGTLESQLHELDHELAHKEALLVDKHTPHMDRVLLLRDIKALSEDQDHLESTLYELQEERAALAHEIRDLKQHSPY